MHKEFLRENHLEIYQMQEEEGKKTLRCFLGRQVVRIYIGCNWLRTVLSDRILHLWR